MNRRTESVVLLLGVGSVLGGGQVLAQTDTWTSTLDFQEGNFINLNPSTLPDQLQINTWQETQTSDPPVLPYLWVALSGRGTVVRIATTTFDPQTGEVSLFVELPSEQCGIIWGLAFTPDGSRLRASLYQTHQIVEFDSAGNMSVILDADDGIMSPSGSNNLADEAAAIPGALGVNPTYTIVTHAVKCMNNVAF